jgi:hypothetical protein
LNELMSSIAKCILEKEASVSMLSTPKAILPANCGQQYLFTSKLGMGTKLTDVHSVELRLTPQTPTRRKPMIEEKRSFARLALRAKANLVANDQTIEAEVVDFNMEGLFLKTVQRIEKNSTVAVTIINTPIQDMEAKVVRVTDSGMGLRFEKSLFA